MLCFIQEFNFILYFLKNFITFNLHQIIDNQVFIFSICILFRQPKTFENININVVIY